MASALERHFALLARRLNAVLFGSRAAAGTTMGAGAALLIVIPLRLSGLTGPGEAIGIFGAVSALGLGLGLATAIPRRLDRAGAALWVDRRLGGAELFTAALYAAGRSPAGRFDAALVERGEAALPAAALIALPRKRLLRNLTAASLALLAGLSASLILSPLAPRRVPGLGIAIRQAAAAKESPDEAFRPLVPDAKAAAALAKQLFPRDRGLAALAERAIEEGKVEELADLLKRAEVALEAARAASKNPIERKALAEEGERLATAADDLGKERRTVAREKESQDPDGDDSEGEDPSGDQDSGQADPGSGGKPGDESPDASPGGGEDAQKGKNPGRPPKDMEPSDEDGEGAGRGGKGTGQEGGTKGAGSGPPGEGNSAEPGTVAGGLVRGEAVESRAKGSPLVIKADPGASYYRSTLPSLEPGAPLSAAAASAAKSAEASVARLRAPLEYGDSVRSYFIQLSAEAARGAKPGEGAGSGAAKAPKQEGASQ